MRNFTDTRNGFASVGVVIPLHRRFGGHEWHRDSVLDGCVGPCAETSRPIRAGEIPAAEGLTTHGEASLGSMSVRAPTKRRQCDDRAVTRKGEGIEPRYLLKPRADRVAPWKATRGARHGEGAETSAGSETTARRKANRYGTRETSLLRAKRVRPTRKASPQGGGRAGRSRTPPQYSERGKASHKGKGGGGFSGSRKHRSHAEGG